MRRRTRQAGYALMTLLLLAALMLIMLGIEVPRFLTQGLREREEEMIFRGEQYRRALALHYRKYGRLPLKLEELAEPQNNLRFLRKLYPDPMSADGKWRIIRVGPLGELVGSLTRRGRIQFQGPGTQKPADKPAEGAPSEPGVGGTNLPIIGVASRNASRAIKVYQEESTYNRWEFIYDPVADALGRAGQPLGPGQPAPSGPPSPLGSPTPPPRP